jgi:hypothetical protein
MIDLLDLQEIFSDDEKRVGLHRLRVFDCAAFIALYGPTFKGIMPPERAHIQFLTRVRRPGSAAVSTAQGVLMSSNFFLDIKHIIPVKGITAIKERC